VAQLRHSSQRLISSNLQDFSNWIDLESMHLDLVISKLFLPLQNSFKHQRYRARTVKKQENSFFLGKNIDSNFWK
jgi:hypothetical protein